MPDIVLAADLSISRDGATVFLPSGSTVTVHHVHDLGDRWLSALGGISIGSGPILVEVSKATNAIVAVR